MEAVLEGIADDVTDKKVVVSIAAAEPLLIWESKLKQADYTGNAQYACARAGRHVGNVLVRLFLRQSNSIWSRVS